MIDECRIAKIDGLEVIGDALLSVVAFRCTDPSINIYAIAQLLNDKEYHLNVLQFPPSIHIACTMLTPPLVPTLISDLKEMVAAVKADPNVGKGATAAIYGTAASVPDRNVIGDVVCGFLDGLTLMPPKQNALV
jgi:sphinganine-1-phosphate aldolase